MRTFYEPSRESWGLGSLSYEQALETRRRGVEVFERTVEVATLVEVCEKYVTSTIDFLKIDVEGCERQVLEGMDFRRWRPRIVVIEATAPLSATQTHSKWEGILLENDYLSAFFDGLNRYYVRAEEPELVPVLAVPVNLFDDFVLHANLQEQEHHRRALEEVQTHVLQQEEMIAEQRQLIQRLQRRIDRLESSQERITRLLAKAGHQLGDCRRIVQQLMLHLGTPGRKISRLMPDDSSNASAEDQSMVHANKTRNRQHGISANRRS